MLGSLWWPVGTNRDIGEGGDLYQCHSHGVLIPNPMSTLSLPLDHSKLISEKSQATVYSQISSGFPLATGLKELFSIGLGGEGVNVDQS